jgi:hypothetical protein
MRGSLLPAFFTELFLNSVLLMLKLPLASSHSTWIQAVAAVTDLTGTRNLV